MLYLNTEFDVSSSLSTKHERKEIIMQIRSLFHAISVAIALCFSAILMGCGASQPEPPPNSGEITGEMSEISDCKLNGVLNKTFCAKVVVNKEAFRFGGTHTREELSAQFLGKKVRVEFTQHNTKPKAPELQKVATSIKLNPSPEDQLVSALIDDYKSQQPKKK